MILALLLASWPAPHARVAVGIGGKLEARNAGGLPLPVRPGVLAALNAQAPDATDGVLRALGLEPLRDPKALEPLRRGARPLTAGERDSRFQLQIQLGGEQGLAVQATVHSLQRAPDIVGQGSARLPVALDPGSAPLALQGALMGAISTAFSDLRTHLHDDVTRPRVHLALRLLPNDRLTDAQHKAAAKLARCAAGLADPLATAALPDGQGYDLELRLKRYDPDETLAQRVKAYAGRLQLELGPDPRARCTTAGTPLAGLSAVILTGPDAVQLRFEQPSP